MTDEDRTPMQATEQAQGAESEQAGTAEAGAQEQSEGKGLLSKIAAAASAAAETAKDVVEAVVDRVPEMAENVVDTAKNLVGKERQQAGEETPVADASGAPSSQEAAPSAAAASAEQEQPSVVETVRETAQDAAATAVAVAQSAASTVRRAGARVYNAVTGAETSQEGEQNAGASFEPTETTARSGRPRRFKDVQAGMQLEGKVTSIALYGVFVDVGVGRDGLVHISEMSETRVESPTDVVQIGDPVTVWVKSVDLDARRISLTMRDPKRSKPPRERRPRKPEVDREKLAQLKPGQSVEGTVSSLSPFGAFVDIGVGKDGLVHISELSEGRIEKPEEAVQVGERYTFRVLEVDPDGKRISLSLRRALRSQRLQQLEPGVIMDGTVSGIAPFGAFVDIGVGRDGLVHISELSSERVATVEDVVKVGDKVQVKVLEIDPGSKRISLTMRVDEPMPSERPAPARATPSYAETAGDVGGEEATARPRYDRSRFERGAERSRERSEGRGRSRGERAGRGGRGEGGRGRREAQIYEPAEEVYTFEDPEEETFTGDATLEDLLSKFNAGKHDRRSRYERRDTDEDEDEGRGSRRQREAIRRTLAMRDEE